MGRDRNSSRTFDIDLDPRNREASFWYGLCGLGPVGEYRVYENVLLVFYGGDEDPFETSHLIGRQADPFLIPHGGQHVLREAHQGLIEVLDRRGAGLEHRVSKHPDIQCHLSYTSSGSTSTRTSSPRVRAEILAARLAARATAVLLLALSKTRHAVSSPLRLSRTGPDISTPASRAGRRRDSTAPESAASEPSKVSEAACANGG